MIKGFLYSTSEAAISASADSGQLNAVRHNALAIDINVTNVTAGSVQFTYERIDEYGVWFTVWQSAAIAATGHTSMTIGPALETAKMIGVTGRLRWTVVTGPVSFTVSIQGQ